MSGKITAIERAAEGLPLTVYIDGRPALEVSEEMARRLGLRVGMEFGAPQPREEPRGAAAYGGGARGGDDSAVVDDERVRAREAAFRLLAVRARSVRELGDRLRRKGLSAAVVEETLDALTATGLLDDREFARAWADERVRLKPVGPMRLRQELTAKGVPAAVVDEVVQETYREHDELELAARALGKRSRGRVPTPREAARLNAFLLRRGFSYEVAALAVKGLAREQTGREDGGR